VQFGLFFYLMLMWETMILRIQRHYHAVTTLISCLETDGTNVVEYIELKDIHNIQAWCALKKNL